MKKVNKFLPYIFLFLICLLIRWHISERVWSDRNKFYWGEKVQTDGSGDSLFFRIPGAGCAVCQFSIPDQETIKVNPGVISAQRYVVTDQYIFYGSNTGTLWRYHRETFGLENDDESLEIEEFHTGVPCTRLSAYNGFLFYGTYRDVCACPLDGNPETDSISLMEQFGEKDEVPRIGERQETVFKGWRISRVYQFAREYGYTLWDVIDEESGEVILEPETHYDYRLDWSCYTTRADKDWVTLYVYPNEAPSYQRAGEEEKHAIECMGDSRYRYSMPKGFTFEDGKVIAGITVCKGANNWLFNLLRGTSPDAEDYDILLEIDLETDTCRILYSTKNSHARILGYRSGMVYCFYDGIIYQESLEEGKREYLFNLSEGEWREYWKKSDSPLVTYWCGDYLLINMAEKTECIYLVEIHQ